MTKNFDQSWLDPIEAAIIYGDDIEEYIHLVHPDQRDLARGVARIKS